MSTYTCHLVMGFLPYKLLTVLVLMQPEELVYFILCDIANYFCTQLDDPYCTYIMTSIPATSSPQVIWWPRFLILE